MYQVKLFNKIAQVGLQLLAKEKYTCSEDLESYDAILVRSAKLHDMAFPENLKCIARAGAGVNNIPVDACAEAGIVVFNTPGANANAVKELVLAAMLMSSRNLLGGAEWVRSLVGTTDDLGPAAEKGKAKFAGPEIAGKTLGVVGLGAIGVRVANAAISLGMKVYGYDPFLSVDAALQLDSQVKHVTEVSDIYKNADYITVHVPLLDSTRGLINKDAIAQMKDGVRLINLARGELVDDAAVAEALKSGKCAFFVSDFASEALLSAPNAIVFPHLGASTGESEDNCACMAAQEISEYLEHGTIRNSVNFPNLKVPFEGGFRITMIHRNVPNLIGSVTSVLSSRGANIENMGNRSRGDIAYTIMDVSVAPTEELLNALKQIDGMIKVRTIPVA